MLVESALKKVSSATCLGYDECAGKNALIINSNLVARIRAATAFSHSWRRVLLINERKPQYTWRRMTPRGFLLPVAEYGLFLSEATPALQTNMNEFDIACAVFVCAFRPKSGKEGRALAALRLEPLSFQSILLAALVKQDVEGQVLSLNVLFEEATGM